MLIYTKEGMCWTDKCLHLPGCLDLRVFQYLLLRWQSALDIQKHENDNSLTGALFTTCEVKFTCNASAISSCSLTVWSYLGPQVMTDGSKYAWRHSWFMQQPRRTIFILNTFQRSNASLNKTNGSRRASTHVLSLFLTFESSFVGNTASFKHGVEHDHWKLFMQHHQECHICSEWLFGLLLFPVLLWSYTQCVWLLPVFVFPACVVVWPALMCFTCSQFLLPLFCIWVSVFPCLC